MAESITFPEEAELFVVVTACPVKVIAEERDDVQIAHGQCDLHIATRHGGKRVVAKFPPGCSESIEIRCPEGIDLSVASLSGDITLRGEFGRVKAISKSGSVRLDQGRQAELRSVSGDLSVGTCEGDSRLTTVSGGVKADDLGGAVKACTVSGSVSLAMRGLGDVSVKSISGDVSVRLPEGVRPASRCRSFSGHVDCPFPEGHDFSLGCKTLSGDIAIQSS